MNRRAPMLAIAVAIAVDGASATAVFYHAYLLVSLEI